MNRRGVLTILFGLSSFSSALSVGGPYYDKRQGKGKKNGQNNDGGDQDSRYFRTEDYGAIEHYYSGARNVPPGLRRKYYRTGTLPPGWQKKLQPFPPELARQLPPPPPNCDRGYIDGVAIVYNRTTRVILDSIDLFGAVSGH
jgi:hypothetical protein